MKTNNTPKPRAKILMQLGLAAAMLGWLAVWRRRRAQRQPFVTVGTNGAPRTALISGASSGIGAAFARQLAAQGYHLVLVARRQERLAALAGELQERHPIQAEILVADLSQPADVERVARRIGELDSLDLLINNAGFGVPGPFAAAEPAKQVEMIHVHILASVRLARAALPGMLARRRGGIINVSSLAAFIPLPGSATYSASKTYLNVFSEGLQAELHGSGVHVQALCPGFTHTGFHDTPEHAGFDRSGLPEALWMSPEQVAAQSLQALGCGRVIFIPGFKNRVLGVAASAVPGWLLPLLNRR